MHIGWDLTYLGHNKYSLDPQDTASPMSGLGEAPITSYFSRVRTPRTRKENGDPSFTSLKRSRGQDEETSKPSAKRAKRRESKVLQSVADNKELRVTRESSNRSDSVPASRESSLTPPPISTFFQPRLCTLDFPTFPSLRLVQGDIIDLTTSEVTRISNHPTPTATSRRITGESSLQTPPSTNPRSGALNIRLKPSARFQPRPKSAHNLPTPMSARRVSKPTKLPQMQPSLPFATPSSKGRMSRRTTPHSLPNNTRNDLPTTPRSGPFPRDTMGGDSLHAISWTPVPSSQTFDVDSYYSHLPEADSSTSPLSKRIDPIRLGFTQHEDECIPSSQTQYYPPCGELPKGLDLPRSSTVILDHDESPMERSAYELVASSQSQIERELSFPKEGSPYFYKRPVSLSTPTSPSKPRSSQRTNSRYKGPTLPLARTESDEIFSLPTRNMSFTDLFHQGIHYNQEVCEVESPKPNDALDDSATESESGDEFFTSRPDQRGASPIRAPSCTTNSTPRRRRTAGRSTTAPPSPESCSTYSSFPDFVKDFRDMFNEESFPRDSS